MKIQLLMLVVRPGIIIIVDQVQMEDNSDGVSGVRFGKPNRLLVDVARFLPQCVFMPLRVCCSAPKEMGNARLWLFEN